MRSSTLTRSVVAVATLALGAAALGAAPATAASSVSRDTVLSVTNSVRTAYANETDYSYGTYIAINKLAAKACGIDFDGDNHVDDPQVELLTAGSADGLLINVLAHEYDSTGDGTFRLCTFAALAATGSGYSLSGKATVTVTPNEPVPGITTTAVASATTQLGGTAILTTPVITPIVNYGTVDSTGTFTATGNAVKTTSSTVKVADKKSKAEKKAAKKKYTKRLASAKKSYAKALDKAGSSKTKKAAAKKAYSAKKASAKAKYKYAIASYKLVKKSTTDKKPFNLSASVPVQFFD